MKTLIISDLHLAVNTPGVARQFIRLLQQYAGKISRLYILGDLFEVWLGDDGITEAHQPLLQAIRQLSDNGVATYFMHGNRDFLIGDYFAEITACTLLDDPAVVDLCGVPTLLMHGDLLCTDDVAYQAFRQQVRNPAWQQEFLAKSIPERIEMAKMARETSISQTQNKSDEIMDANPETVKSYLIQYDVSRLIHGHTHRPGIHKVALENKVAERIVLGDWSERISSYLLFDENGYTLTDPRAARQIGGTT